MHPLTLGGQHCQPCMDQLQETGTLMKLGESSMQHRYEEVKLRLSQAAAMYGRPATDIRLIAVSKQQPAERVVSLWELGHHEFGENYAQELLAKAAALAHLPDLRWIYIGHLQSNKIKNLVAVASEIQTVGSYKHAALIARYARELGKAPYPVYLALNAGEEASKSGLSFAEVGVLARQIEAQLPELSLEGVMSIPPQELADAGPIVPPLYHDIKKLAAGVGKGLLSLGMSSDLELAIGAGSDCVRIGTGLFGPRAS